MNKPDSYRPISIFERILAQRTFLFSTIMFFCLFPKMSFGTYEPEPLLDEVSVYLNAKNIGTTEVPAIIRSQYVFLSVTDVFDFIKIKNNFTVNMDSVVGFFASPDAPFIIDKANDQITYKGKVFDLAPQDLIKSESKHFLKLSYFNSVFDLDCSFNFRSLMVTLSTAIELPAVKEKRQELMRTNYSRLKGEISADTTIKRKYPIAHFGMADWFVISTQQPSSSYDLRTNLVLGGLVLGGETNLSLNYNNRERFTEKQQYYLWRYANNDNKFVKQIIAGKMVHKSISSINSPIVGVQITNTPTISRRTFGNYTLSNYTEPGWVVELYVNNEMIDYVKSDASGFYSFQVPLFYGNSVVKLKFYGPWGEERSNEQNFSIPFNFLPKGDFEYNIGGGIVQDGFKADSITRLFNDTIVTTRIEGKPNSNFSRANFNYGVNRSITVGGGMEYLSSVMEGKSIPFINTSIALNSSLLLTSEYAQNVRSKSVLTYRTPSNASFELNYSRYARHQNAINNNYIEERRVVATLPIRKQNFSGISRFTVNHIVLKQTNFTSAEWLLSFVARKVNTNINTFALFTDQNRAHIYSNLSLAFRLPAGIIITPQAQFEYLENNLTSAKLMAEKRIWSHGYLTSYYEKNFKNNFYQFGISFRYQFSFAQTGITSVNNNNTNTLIKSARGSFIYDQKSKYHDFNNRSNVGMGGINIISFLDLNANGKKDAGEPKVKMYKFKCNGGRIQVKDADTSVVITDLEPYTSHVIEISANSFDNIAWQVKNHNIKVYIDPNYIKTIEVPVKVSAEVSGTVSMVRKGIKKDQGKITICIYDSNSKLVGKTLSESDGFFSFLGLNPGTYTVMPDENQMSKLKMTSSPEKISIKVNMNKEGDVIDGLDFDLGAGN